MSSVLRPVGPERPVVYWFRRGIIVVIVVAVLLLLVHVLSGGSSSPSSGGAPANTPSPRASATSTTTHARRCTSGQLTATLSTDKAQYTSGEPATFTATFRNASGTPCRLHSPAASRRWRVTSGPATTWATSGCPPAGHLKTARLTATRTATVSIVWDAHRNDSSCTTGALASPGTYVLRGRFGSVAGKPVVFHVLS